MKNLIKEPSAGTLYMRRWREKNREKNRSYNKRYWGNNRHKYAEGAMERARLWYDQHRDEIQAKHLPNHLRRKFGMTMDGYLELLVAQNGTCAICSNECASGDRLSVDHDHTTGKVRGLLCRKCNAAIGLLGDSPELVERALSYLKNFFYK